MIASQNIDIFFAYMNDYYFPTLTFSFFSPTNQLGIP